MRNVVIFGGGVTCPVAEHLSISAPSYGGTANRLASLFSTYSNLNPVVIHTKMANNKSKIETIFDLENEVDRVIEDPETKVVVFNCAVPNFMHPNPISGRIATQDELILNLVAAPKLVDKFRKLPTGRKEIFLVAFKTTNNATSEEMFNAGLKLCKESSCNLVLVNDLITRNNMIITPEEAKYCETTDRNKVLQELVEIATARSHLSFTRSTVIGHEGVAWNDDRVPANLREVVNHCIAQNAYKEGYPGSGSTVGHFACRLSDTEFVTSKRKTNFNDLDKIGMVLVKTDGNDHVYAYGGKPSVGGQSQRIIFREHEGMDCIVHFHCPVKENPRDYIPYATQKFVECGSHQCGKNTSDHLKELDHGIKAVYLDQHGPNIVFSKDTDPKHVIEFIEANFELDQKTDGYQRG
jgi:hypothetical protein